MIKRLKTLLFENKGIKQTVIKNFFWLSFGQIASRFIRAAIIIYAARILGAAEYGVFSYALGLAGFFTIFSEVGINEILTREASQKPDMKSYFFATSFWLRSFLLFGTALVIIFVAPHFSKIEAAKALIPFVAFLTIFDGIREFSNSFLRALERMELEALITVLTNIAITVAGFVILSFSISAQALTFAYAASAGIGALAAVFVLRVEYRKVFTFFRRDLIRPLVHSALPVAVITLLGAFMLNTDMILLGWWRTAEELGLYAAAMKVVQVLYTFPGILASALFPALSRLIGQGKTRETQSLTEQSMAIVFLFSLPITVGGIVLADPIIKLLYGTAYLPAVLTFQLLMLTLVIMSAASPVSNLVIAHNKQRKILLPVFLASMSNVILDILLIPTFGIAGSAVATIIANTVSVGLMWKIVKKTIHFKTIRYIKKALIATAVLGVAAFALNLTGLNVIITIIVSALVYFGVLVVLKEPLLREFSAMKNAILRKPTEPEGV